MAKDPAILAHQEWLGYVQPTGLVVSIPALIDASAFLNRNYGPDHQRFLSALPQDADGEPIPEFPSFVRFSQDVLGWDTALLVGAGTDSVPAELEVNLENYNETLRPTYALRSLNGESKWLLLVDVLPTGTNLDQVYAPHDRGWQASPQARFERLLRQTGVSTGLLVNGHEIRLVYAPEKELSGHITFKLTEMVQVAGRPIFAALQMLLGSERLFSVADKERLPAILSNSRKYQNVVSTKLAEQVLEALYELLRGFQAANDQMKGELLRDVLARDPDHVYHGLLTTLLRLVFVLYAEDRGLLSTDPIYSNYYSIRGLYEGLRADAGRYTDTMDQRYGAWAQLLALFRLIYSGGSHGGMKIPAREGYLFDPDRYLFLEGRHEKKDKPSIPRVSDGVVYRVLSKLVLLDGERLSYRTLAVEQIGSIYQAIMGFSLRVATGRAIAIKAVKRHGAPATIDLEVLLGTPPEKRLKRFTDETDQKLTGTAADALKSANSVEEVLAALDRKIAVTVTPVPVPKGAMVFQPSDERRKSGSHYTPSTLTGPIVEAALGPVLKQLGPNPTPAQILNLKVCDPAMGSAAFLVEACRQLGDALVNAWHAHNEVHTIPLDEDESLHAQRVVAQRCLYGLDKNFMAADLAKLSLWLATLAKDHPFTFLDHTLRHGDALVGLTSKQIASFNWAPAAQRPLFEGQIPKRIERAAEYRRRILEARDNVSYARLAQELTSADEALNLPRMIGDATIATFFSAQKPKQREEARKRLQSLVEADLKNRGFISVGGEVDGAITKLRTGAKGIVPFHWDLEFPEVFTRDKEGAVTGGFDVIVGNPPFAGKNMIIHANRDGYIEWLQATHAGSHGASDLVAHFFRRAFHLIRKDGVFGLIATNTVAQGDTRQTGLQRILEEGGQILRAQRRLQWPGEAAVVVSFVHIIRGTADFPILDGKQVKRISAFLVEGTVDASPVSLQENAGKSYKGAVVLGMGFTFDDVAAEKGTASSIGDMNRLIMENPDNQAVIFPYIGGEELNNDPQQRHRRFVIDFGDATEAEARKRWPELMRIVEARVKPQRELDNREARKKNWWRFGERQTGLFSTVRNQQRVIAISEITPHLAFAFLPTGIVYAHTLKIITLQSFAGFATLQSRVHESWVRRLGSTFEDRILYAPTDVFRNFPFPRPSTDDVESCGSEYYLVRAEIMRRRAEGLTKTYNRFHDPNESSADILSLRELHNAMDRAVLIAYRWSDIKPACEFLLDYEIDEDEWGDKKKPWRYRWPDETRDEVLGRLLDLNCQRAVEQGQPFTEASDASAADENEKKKKHVTKSTAASTAHLFASETGED
jgi:N-6 DNA Methylase